MEGTVIRSQSGFSAVRLRSRAAGRHTGANRLQLQKTQATPDYLTSLFSTESSVDSSPDSFSPVLPVPAVATVLVRKYFRRSANVRDAESLSRDGRSMHSASPGPHRKERRAPAPAIPRGAAGLPGES